MITRTDDMFLRRPSNDSQPRKPVLNEDNKPGPEPPPGQSKRPLSTPATLAPSGTLSSIGNLNLGGTPHGSDDVTMQDVSDDGEISSQPRKRAAIGDGISAGSGSPFRETSSSPPPRRSKAQTRPTSAPYSSIQEDTGRNTFESPRPNVGKKTLWSPEHDSTLTRSSVDRSNIASIQAQKSRAQSHRIQARPGKFQASPQVLGSRSANLLSDQISSPQAVVSPRSQLTQTSQLTKYDIIMQPETVSSLLFTTLT